MIFRVIQIAIPFIWFGAVAVISFMETPLKFTAPSVTLPIGLEIGHIVFHALNKVEIGLGIALLISIVFAKPEKKLIIILFCIIVTILVLQTFWLFPLLDERTFNAIKGIAQPDSYLHIYYIIFDASKLILLMTLGIITTKENLKLK